MKSLNMDGKGIMYLPFFCFIYIIGIILAVVLLLIFSVVGIGYVTIVYNSNMILIMMLFVVSSIFTFVSYYMRGDVSSDNFKLLKVLFLGLMVFILTSFRVVIFIGWEGIGVISICLIRY